jgi:hypothetical protein
VQVFHLEDERSLPTALETHLRQGGQGPGFPGLRAEGKERLRALRDIEEVQERRSPRLRVHPYFLETAVEFDGDILGAISLGNPTVVSQEL